MDGKELRALRFQLIVALLNADALTKHPALAEQIKVYVK